jgi:hypothetical protein
MAELNELKHLWREADTESIAGSCSKEEVVMLLQGRSAEIKKQILKRLTAEIKTYLLIALFLLLCAVVVQRFNTGRASLFGLCALLVVVPAVGALAYKEYRLRTLPMSGSLLESISALIRAIDSTVRLYVLAYVTTFVVLLAILEIVLVRGNGWNLLTIILVPIGISLIGWSYVSGRRYASRMFKVYRSDLVKTLNDLESV